MAVTPNYGFKLPEPGHMVFGVDVIAILKDIDARLYQALQTDQVQESGSITAAGPFLPSPGWVAALLDNENEFKFAQQVELSNARIIVPAATNVLGGVGVMLDFALASTGPAFVPLLAAPVALPTGGVALDTAVAFPAGTTVPVTDEVVVICDDTLTVGGTVSIEVALEANLPV